MGPIKQPERLPLGDKTLTKRVVQSGRTGWYVRVIKEGTISREDLAMWDTTDSSEEAVELIKTGLTNPDVFRERRMQKIDQMWG